MLAVYAMVRIEKQSRNVELRVLHGSHGRCGAVAVDDVRRHPVADAGGHAPEVAAYNGSVQKLGRLDVVTRPWRRAGATCR